MKPPDHPSNSTGGEASERAVEATARKWCEIVDGPGVEPDMQDRHAARHALASAHDPALGEDRSVRLGDMLDALRKEGGRMRASDSAVTGVNFAVHFLAREFGADDHAR